MRSSPSLSAEIFLQCFRNKRLHYFPIDVVERVFADDIASRGEDEDGGADSLWRVHDRQGGRGVVRLRRAVDDESRITGLTLNGATGAVFDRVFDIIKETHAVVYWPGGTRYVVADDIDLTTHLPDNFLDIFPARLAVRSGAEMEERICG